MALQTKDSSLRSSGIFSPGATGEPLQSPRVRRDFPPLLKERFNSDLKEQPQSLKKNWLLNFTSRVHRDQTPLKSRRVKATSPVLSGLSKNFG